MHFYYDRQGRPISNEEWTATFEATRANRRVALDDFGRGGRVSTVWLGLNHAYDDGPPLIFETMVFGGPLDDYCDRYSTEEQALTGHRFVCIWLGTLLRPRRPLIHNGRKPR